MSNIDMNMIELTDADLEMVSAAGSDGASVGAVIGFAVGCVLWRHRRRSNRR